ncbi:MAG: hypothetical protein ACPLRH_05325, partial [Desulfotomaculales bacterium]
PTCKEALAFADDLAWKNKCLVCGPKGVRQWYNPKKSITVYAANLAGPDSPTGYEVVLEEWEEEEWEEEEEE